MRPHNYEYILLFLILLTTCSTYLHWYNPPSIEQASHRKSLVVEPVELVLKTTRELSCSIDGQCEPLETCLHNKCVPFWPALPVNRTQCHDTCRHDIQLYEKHFYLQTVGHFVHFQFRDQCVVAYQHIDPAAGLSVSDYESQRYRAVLRREIVSEHWILALCTTVAALNSVAASTIPPIQPVPVDKQKHLRTTSIEKSTSSTEIFEPTPNIRHDTVAETRRVYIVGLAREWNVRLIQTLNRTLRPVAITIVIPTTNAIIPSVLKGLSLVVITEQVAKETPRIQKIVQLRNIYLNAIKNIPPSSVIVVVDFDNALPNSSIGPLRRAVDDVHSGEWDAICANGQAYNIERSHTYEQSHKHERYYYDGTATILMNGSFAYPVEWQTNPQDLEKTSIESVSRLFRQGDVAVQSCFGGIAVYRNFPLECQYEYSVHGFERYQYSQSVC